MSSINDPVAQYFPDLPTDAALSADQPSSPSSPVEDQDLTTALLMELVSSPDFTTTLKTLSKSLTVLARSINAAVAALQPRPAPPITGALPDLEVAPASPEPPNLLLSAILTGAQTIPFATFPLSVSDLARDIGTHVAVYTGMTVHEARVAITAVFRNIQLGTLPPGPFTLTPGRKKGSILISMGQK